MPGFKNTRSVIAVRLFLSLALLLSGQNLFAFDNSKLNLSEEELQWIAENPSISVAFDGYFPPYSFLNDNGELEGFSVDVFKILGQRLGLEINPYPQNEWSELYSAAQQYELDAVATMVEREERTEWFLFTEPYIQKSLVIITRSDDQRISHRDDLATKTVALVKDYQYSKRIAADYPKASLVYVDTMLDALNAVSLGDADAAVSFLGAGHFYRTKYLLTNLKYAALYDKRNSPESISIRKDKPELASVLSKALNSIPEAQLQSLREKWLPIEYLNTLIPIELTEEEQQWIKKHPEIRLGVDPEFAPFEFIENGLYQGMAADYIRLLNQRLHLNMEVVPDLSWSEVTSKARNFEVDVLPAVGITEERKEFLNFTEPYLKFHRVIVTDLDAPFIVGLKDLKTKIVAVQENSSHHGFIKENSNIEPVTYTTLKEALLAVSGGEADAFVGNVASTSYWIQKLNLTNLKVAAPVSREVQSLHFAVRKDWPELVSILQKGLDSITPKQQAEIAEKWTTIEYGYEFNQSLIWKISITVLTFFVMILIWNIMLNRKVRHQTSQILRSAHYDHLTNLPNRFLIQDRLGQRINEARQMQEKVAMFSIDLDEFKKINDSYGHAAGDSILKTVAKRLSSVLKQGDTLGRLSADQFLMLLCDFKQTADIAGIASAVEDQFRKPFKVRNRQFTLSASIGIAIFPYDGDSPAELIKNADSATHHAKAMAKGSYVFYTEELNSKVSRQLELEEALRVALRNNELALAYQPKVKAKTNEVFGFEALLRWNSKSLGTVSPYEFIPVAEKTGLIETIGDFVIGEALSFLARIQNEFGNRYTMAINISPTQFGNLELVTRIVDAIKNENLNSADLEIEVTEGVLMGGYPLADTILKQLIEHGIQLAMDDFGTGYSSMSNLRRFKFNTLKIDREFINELPNDSADCKLVKATILMAHSLGMKVVAEGVETEEQADFLKKHRCDYLQGWHYGKPASPDIVLENLAQQTKP